MTARRQFLARSSSLLWLLAAPEIARGATIVAVRVWPASDYTRVTLESDGALSATHFLVAGPDRLVVDVKGLELSDRLRQLVAKIRPDDPYLADARVAQYAPDVVRIVFDLKRAVKPQVFTLPPVAAYRNRMVFDLYPAEAAPAPLVAAANPPRDSLGDWLRTHRAQLDGDNAVATAPPARRDRRPEHSVLLALDPGHGGEDPGATGPGGTHEKDVVLLIARHIRELALRTPNVRVMMTRDSDYFVPLWNRVQKAQLANADLFTSVHADGWYTPQARGASVYCLSDHGASSVEARMMAQRENAADAVGGIDIHTKDYQVAKVMLDMSTAAQINASLKMASRTLQQLGDFAHLHANQVQQAGFVVLKSPSVPSMLVETAFISNPEEEARLQTPAYRHKVARAIFDGIREYLATRPPLARRRTLA
ncbi:N-acetylmuramoyl-L-alanine amidase AmiC precursor [mine drainage metagenome]|jgi:N-acetylmuramoyl-L-alanine amidase|uniref:N-acetylmuramoyl-L-alanine amidase AmiC n=1 Tax=mine drainage metagenome TaxID=410659 RepID=A0A1J5Q2R3_9ZZZZ